MSSSIIRDTFLNLLRFLPLRPLLSQIAQARYQVEIHPSAVIAANVDIPRGIKIKRNVTILSGALLSENVTVEENTRFAGYAPKGAVISGSPGQIRGYNCSVKTSASSKPLAQEALFTLLQHFEFNSVLDVGCGSGWHTSKFIEHGKQVTCLDIGESEYFRNFSGDENARLIVGDYLTTHFPEKPDCIWLSHVLEHQPNIQVFLEKLHNDLEEGGILAITVPPAKNEIVGGHVNFFNMGLLLYRLVLAGFDCSEAHCKQYGYNLSVILKKRSIQLPGLEWDCGDIERLAEFFPFAVGEGFPGDFDLLNWPGKTQA